ncbi:MAG: ATP-binding protein [Chitinophagaceae bacterium]|nr:ATP-binding protein [Chitinophagaceae bacterium]
MYKRFITKSIVAALEDTPAILITGARQTGKSTLCLELIEKGEFKGSMVTLDDPATLLAVKKDSLGFLRDIGKHIIIDEVQRAPELFLSMKKLIDEDRKGWRFILTGSADVMTMPKVADSLAGRIEMHTLWPLSQAEIHDKKPTFIETLVSGEKRFTNKKSEWTQIVQAIKKGGYPEALQRTSENRRDQWFESYLLSLMQKDIRELSNIEGLTQIPNILHLIATRVGSTINFSDIGRLAGVKTPTLHRYLALLEQVFIIHKIPAWTTNAEGQFVKSPRIILNDTGLLCHLRGEAVDSLIGNRTTAGNFFENFVVLEIIKQLSWSETPLKPYHFSIHQGAEVDLVLEDRKKQLYGIEIKSTATIKEADFKGLEKLSALAGNRFKRGIVLYTGDQALSGFGKNIHAVPIGALWS